MGDFGLYAALSGTDNWAQKRQDKMSNLMMLERMEQRSEKQVAAQMQAEAGIQEMLDKMSTFDVLPEDQKAIEQKEQEARLGIIKGITKFNGDLKKYMASGGVTDLGDYQRSILTSSEMKNAVSNKAQYAQYIDAKQKDMFVGRAEIDVPVFDKNGNPKTENGEIVRERKNLTMEEQMALRKRGLLDRIQVGMIEKKGNVNPEYFKRNYKDARKPWSADNIVTEIDVREALKLQGISDEQTDQIAKGYGKGLTNENALKWKAMNPLELQLMKASIEDKKSAAKARGGTGSTKTRIINRMVTDYDKLSERPSQMLPEKGPNAKPGARGAALTVTNDENNYMQKLITRMNPKAYDAHFATLSQEDIDDGHGIYDLSNAIVNLQQKVSVVNPLTGEKEPMIKARVFYRDGQIPEYVENAVTSNWTDHDYELKPYYDKKEQEQVTPTIPGKIGITYISIKDFVEDKGLMAELAADVGLGTNVNAAPPGATNYSNYQKSQQDIESMTAFLQQTKGWGEALSREVAMAKLMQQ